MNSLDQVQQQAAALQRAIDEALTEQEARRYADELHALIDSVHNVAVLPWI